MADEYFHDLPVEVFYRIFDNLDINTILRSIRPVCRRFYNIVTNYDQFELNFTSMSQPNIAAVARLIQPNHISSITFSDVNAKRLNEIQLFLSVFDIRRFSQLKSLTFGQIKMQNKQTLINLLKERSKYDLLRLRLSNLDRLIEYIIQPIHLTLQHLTICICTYDQYRIILRHSPNLKRFTVEYCDIDDEDETPKSLSDDLQHRQLKSLTIHNCQLPIKYLRLFLILTPSLVHLKLISPRPVFGPVFDGSFWEQLVQIRLPCLKNFEFFFIYDVRRTVPIHSVNSIIATFRTPFWIDNKHWLTTCDYIMTSSQITVYTIPIRMNDYEILVRCKASPVNSVCHLFEHQTNQEGDITLTENLITLDLKGYRIGEQGSYELGSILSNNTTLNTLNLQENHIRNEGIRQLTDALRTSTVLTTLNLGNNQIGASGAQCLAEILRTNSSIRALYLPLNEIKDDGIEYLAGALRNNTTLTTLSLRFNQMADRDAAHLAMALENNTALTTLDLGGNNFGAVGIQLLANALTQNTMLTTLDLEGNNFGSKAAQHLANALPYMTTLNILNLSLNQIWNEGAQSIANALPNNTSLTTLNLTKNDIEESGAQNLADALQKNEHLIELNLSRNTISDETLQLIARLLLRNERMQNSN